MTVFFLSTSPFLSVGREKGGQFGRVFVFVFVFGFGLLFFCFGFYVLFLFFVYMYVQFISSIVQALYSFLFYFYGFCSIKLFLIIISYLPHNLIVQCFTHARLSLRECEVVTAVCEVYCVLCGRELNYYLVSSCFSLVYLRPHFHIL